jgi:hypothetical protein
MESGHAIFLTGVPSSGKTTLAKRLEAELPGFLALLGDKTIRRMSAETGDSAYGLFVQLLDLVESRLASTNLIVDMSLPGSYVTEARSRFGRAALFVALRLTEADRSARDAVRGIVLPSLGIRL